jgi:acetyltransferase
MELVQTVAWREGSVVLRPIRPEDEARHLAFLGRLDPTDIRMRVFYSRRSIERTELARLTQIDYEREMAFVATAPGPAGEEETLGVARAMTDPDNIGAEFGIVVRSDLKGTGLGRLLMGKLVAYLRQRGTQCMHATVLKENTRMLAMTQAMGFVHDAEQPADDTVAVTLTLVPPAAA